MCEYLCVYVDYVCGDVLIKCPHWYTAALWGQTNWSIVQQAQRGSRETEGGKEGWSLEGHIDNTTALEIEGRECVLQNKVCKTSKQR